MENPSGRQRQWFWSGVALLSVSEFIWLITILGNAVLPRDYACKIIASLGVLVAPVATGYGVYCLDRGRIAHALRVATPEERWALRNDVYVIAILHFIIGLAYFVATLMWFTGLLAGLVFLVLSGAPLIQAREKGFKSAKDAAAKNRGIMEEQEAMAEALCRHLRQIGLDATVKSKECKQIYSGLGWSNIVASVKVENRNIDFVELEERCGCDYESNELHCYYSCNGVVQANVEGLENKLRAKANQVKEGFWRRELVDITWEGGELAQVLNSDAKLKNNHFYELVLLKIVPYKKEHCIRIEKSKKFSGISSPRGAFPTIETLEAYDRVAKHIRSVAANARV